MPKNKESIEWLKLLVSVAGAIAVGSSGAIFTSGAVQSWYQTIQKPWFNPPSWVFGPVWTCLFILMGLAFYRVWHKGLASKNGLIALRDYVFQFIFNVAWSAIFFGQQAYLLAFFELLVLWWLVYRTIVSFTKVDKLAGQLLWPYLAWTSFAAVLNLSIAWLN